MTTTATLEVRKDSQRRRWAVYRADVRLTSWFTDEAWAARKRDALAVVFGAEAQQWAKDVVDAR